MFKPFERNICPITKEDDLELLYSFKKFPIFMGCVNTPNDSDLTQDMNWYIGKNNGIIQLNPLIPIDILYNKSHGSGTVGALWDKHHKEFAKFISQYQLKNLMEIGAGHGKMIFNYLELHPDSKWDVIEPNPKIKDDHRVSVTAGLFDENSKINQETEAIVHSHVIEHLYHPLELLNTINKKVANDILHIFSVPNLEVMLKRNYTNALNFEHTIFLNETTIESVLKQTGFEIIKKEYFMEDHSIFYATRRIEKKENHKSINQYNNNKNLYINYIDYHLKLISDLNKKIDNADSDVYLFGAHVFSQYLISMGLNQDKIKCILDNDINKQDKRLYGTSLKVKSPQILKDTKSGYIILKTGVYNEEIKNDIALNINNEIIFWE